MPDSKALVKCKKLEFSYDSGPVLSGVEFDVKAGEYICIVGENGAGKSTLVKGLLGLKRPSAGSIEFCDVDSGEIGYMPQQTSIQRDFPATVMEVVLSGCLNSMRGRLFYGEREKNLAKKHMQSLSIWDRRDSSFRDLSGGQQQRALLSRALCAAGKLILLDEPAAGLDPLVTKEFYETIKKVSREQGIAVLMVSHDIHSAMRYSDKILHLKHRQLFFGTVAEYEATELGRSYIGSSCQYAAPAIEHIDICSKNYALQHLVVNCGGDECCGGACTGAGAEKGGDANV